MLKPTLASRPPQCHKDLALLTSTRPQTSPAHGFSPSCPFPRNPAISDVHSLCPLGLHLSLLTPSPTLFSCFSHGQMQSADLVQCTALCLCSGCFQRPLAILSFISTIERFPFTTSGNNHVIRYSQVNSPMFYLCSMALYKL